jgi:Delta6-protoilludene synthase
MDLPDEAVHHPMIEDLSILTSDMILLDNVGCAYFGCVTRLTICST